MSGDNLYGFCRVKQLAERLSAALDLGRRVGGKQRMNDGYHSSSGLNQGGGIGRGNAANGNHGGGEMLRLANQFRLGENFARFGLRAVKTAKGNIAGTLVDCLLCKGQVVVAGGTDNGVSPQTLACQGQAAVFLSQM